jgi:hypothetical protein
MIRIQLRVVFDFVRMCARRKPARVCDNFVDV